MSDYVKLNKDIYRITQQANCWIFEKEAWKPSNQLNKELFNILSKINFTMKEYITYTHQVGIKYCRFVQVGDEVVIDRDGEIIYLEDFFTIYDPCLN